MAIRFLQLSNQVLEKSSKETALVKVLNDFID